MIEVRWLTAFLDSGPSTDPIEVHDASVGFWRSVTGYDVSPARGSHGQFVSLVPPDGDAYLRAQRLDAGPPGVHLDLTVSAVGRTRPSPWAREDVETMVPEVVALGARVLATLDDVVVMRSPGGLSFCLLDGPKSRRAAPTDWGGHRSLVDQVCVDVPDEWYDAEKAFWAALTGWTLQAEADQGITCFTRPEGQPLRLILQRLDEPTGPARAHLDLATDDRAAEVARHVALGAEAVRRTPWWTTLRDPVGRDYCVTDRDPSTGLL